MPHPTETQVPFTVQIAHRIEGSPLATMDFIEADIINRFMETPEESLEDLIARVGRMILESPNPVAMAVYQSLQAAASFESS